MFRDRDLHRKIDHLAVVLDCLLTATTFVKERVNQLASREDLDAALQSLKDAIADATTRVANDLQSLRDQLANGTPITDADLQSVKQDIAGVANIDPGAPPSSKK